MHVIIVGQRGSGKTTMLNKILSDNKGLFSLVIADVQLNELENVNVEERRCIFTTQLLEDIPKNIRKNSLIIKTPLEFQKLAF